MQQLELFKNKAFFIPQSRGLVSWFDLSINEKINFKSNNFYSSIDRPYSEGLLDDIGFTNTNCLSSYIQRGETEQPNHFQKYKH